MDNRREAMFGALISGDEAALVIELTYDGDATVTVYETGNSAPIVTLTFAMNALSVPYETVYECPTPDHAAAYTITLSIDDLARDIGVRTGASSINICLYAPELVVSSDAWSCITPSETALVFAPLYNRRLLVNANDQPASSAQRAEYRRRVAEYAQAHPSDRAPWNKGFVVNGQHLHIKEPADATGTFHPGMEEFSRYWGVPAENQFRINNGLATELQLGYGHAGEGDAVDPAARRTEVIARLEEYYRRHLEGSADAVSAIAFFCHGWRQGLQLGITGVTAANAAAHRGLQELVTAIKKVSREDVIVVLYACLTAEPPNDGCSFAALLRDALIAPPRPKPRCRVVGHLQRAHAYKTPDIMFFEGTAGRGAPGMELVPGTLGNARSQFQRILQGHTSHTGLRWAFPFMSVESVRAFVNMASPPQDAYALP